LQLCNLANAIKIISMNHTRNSIKIRLAKTREAFAISDLLRHSFAEYKSLYTEKAFEATVLSVHEIETRIKKNAVWIALYNDAIAGTVSLIPNDDGIFIKSVAVAPIARRKGLGKELMKHAEETAIKKEVKYLELTTTPFLFEAIRLYEYFGFRQNGYDDLYGTLLIRMIKYLRQTPLLSGETMRFNN
jgi:ribosomal protein S18 acetylase RimI-like enzyme